MASATPEVCKDYLDADPNVTQHIVRYENLNADLRILRFVSLSFDIRQTHRGGHNVSTTKLRCAWTCSAGLVCTTLPSKETRRNYNSSAVSCQLVPRGIVAALQTPTSLSKDLMQVKSARMLSRRVHMVHLIRTAA